MDLTTPDLATLNSIYTENPFFSRPGTALVKTRKTPDLRLPRKKLKSFKETVASYRAKHSDI